MRGEGDKALRDGTAMRELAEEQLRAVKAHEASIHQSQRQLAAVSNSHLHNKIIHIYLRTYVHMYV